MKKNEQGTDDEEQQNNEQECPEGEVFNEGYSCMELAATDTTTNNQQCRRR